MENENFIITIDGPTGTGKSVTAQYLAYKLGCKYYDTGLFYRAVTSFVLKSKIKLTDYHAICKAAHDLKIWIEDDKLLLNDEDITAKLKEIEVTNKVSGLSKISKLRQIINEKIRVLDDGNTSFVIEGKDTGVDVFPNAQFKFYLVSDMSARIARRQQDFLDNGQKFSKEKIAKELKLRDDVEIKKAPAIVKKAKDAIKVDTTNMIVEEQVNYLYRIITNPELNLIQPEGQQPQGN